ncbi:metal-dependent hydrolase [[Eubacterium] cellulosolvens]
MLPVAHFATAFFIGKSLRLKYLWVAMVFALLPDITLFFLDWLGPALGLNEKFGSTTPINLFLHSVFGLAIVLVLIPIKKEYFYAGLVGYGSHIIFDYMTHATIRYPFYPISNWSIPIFVITYVDKMFMFGSHIIFFILLLIVIFTEFKDFNKSVLNKYNSKRLLLMSATYLLVSISLGLFYAILMNFPAPMVYFAMPLVVFNMVTIGGIFILELKKDKKFEFIFRRLLKWFE